MRIADGGGGTRPADEIVLTEHANILAEHKRTEGTKFQLSFLRQSQIQGLVDFDEVLARNVGIVFISFHNPKRGLDEAFAIRLTTLLKYLKAKERQYVTIEELEQGWGVGYKSMSIRVHRLTSGSHLYDLKGVVQQCKFL